MNRVQRFFRWVHGIATLPARLKEEYNRKISEAHLKIRTGECTPEQLDAATVHLREIQNKKMKLI